MTSDDVMSYICCRCGYTTVNKSSMKHHLWNRKQICEPTHFDIDLTPEIKGHILYDKSYIVRESDFRECKDVRNRMVYLVRKYLNVYECVLIESDEVHALERYYAMIKRYSIAPFVTNITDLVEAPYMNIYETTLNTHTNDDVDMYISGVGEMPSWDVASGLINMLEAGYLGI